MLSEPASPFPAPASPFPELVEGWWRDGERAFAAAVERLTDANLDEPSRLPDWSRATVVAHLARNADALVNLLTWARTGVETPMYASAEGRDADIASTAAQPAATLRADAVAATARLAAAVARMSVVAWTATVRTNQGRAVVAADVPWMRAREVWVHAVDLDAGIGFSDLPVDFCSALVDDVLALLARRDQDLTVALVAAGEQRWGSGSTVVQGPVNALAGWLTRADSSGLSGNIPPDPPRWL